VLTVPGTGVISSTEDTTYVTPTGVQAVLHFLTGICINRGSLERLHWWSAVGCHESPAPVVTWP